ncbi:hypothetical protein [Halogeometricum limi]|uniref:Uncharacterized protein n=1 Tax=Halogeometricum limi TaxID=555875 RepID=A0A1I6GZ39_9EURY|nr:hypothetical protein [Halogeometricum limi]SFR47466.1 hypothetical protein SAMN04488124_1734 [Halogeometricum limi]
MNLPGTFDHDAWRTVAATGVGYGLLLLAMTVVLFVLPYLVVSSFA